MKYILLFFIISNCFAGGMVFPDRDLNGDPIVNQYVFKKTKGERVRATGIMGEIPPTSTSSIFYKFSESRFIEGTQLILENHNTNDKVNFYVVDADNVTVDQFGTDWNVATDKQDQGAIRFPYASKIPKDYYIYVEYLNTGTSTVMLKTNLFLHKAP